MFECGAFENDYERRYLIRKIPEIEQSAAGADFALCGGQNDDFPSGPDSDATSVYRLHPEEQMHTDILTLYHENMVKMHTCILMW